MSLYNEYNSDITGTLGEADLYLINEATGAKVYNPNNYWNFTSTTGSIAHLIHPSNTLSAEIDIAAQSTVLRKGKDGKLITNQTKLTNCSKYGNPERHSDPTVSKRLANAPTIMLTSLTRLGSTSTQQSRTAEASQSQIL